MGDALKHGRTEKSHSVGRFMACRQGKGSQFSGKAKHFVWCLINEGATQIHLFRVVVADEGVGGSY